MAARDAPAALRAIVGDAHVLRPEDEPRYLEDETGAAAGVPLAIVRPADTGEVAAVVRLCAERGWALVAQGGRTGLVRGATAQDGEIILSTERLRAIGSADAEGMTLAVGGGAVLAAVQEAARAAGLRFGVDIGARGSCTVGGMIATNAGGHQVLRFGMMRDNVLGLEAVLADGTVLTAMQPMLKNNAGFDLKHLLIGTEGTLGIVTRALLRLRPAPAVPATVAMVAATSYPAAIRLFRTLDAAIPGRILAFEAMWPRFYAAAAAARPGAAPFAAVPPLAVLIEVEDDRDAVLAHLGEALEAGLLADAAVAGSHAQAEALWAIRDAIGELMPAMAVAEPFDVSMAIERIGPVAAAVEAELLARWPACRPLFFGHVADGNLHLALGLEDARHRADAQAIVYDLVREAEGSVSAEHGIGMAKRAWLRHSRSEAEIATMRRLKRALDPGDILARGRVIG